MSQDYLNPLLKEAEELKAKKTLTKKSKKKRPTKKIFSCDNIGAPKAKKKLLVPIKGSRIFLASRSNTSMENNQTEIQTAKTLDEDSSMDLTPKLNFK